jgi:hypothetical protein
MSSACAIESAPTIDAETAKLTATEYCLFHFPTLYTAGTPSLASQCDGVRWTVPIVLATPARGLLGQVGELHIDARSGQVIGSTDRSAVIAAGEQLYHRKK